MVIAFCGIKITTMDLHASQAFMITAIKTQAPTVTGYWIILMRGKLFCQKDIQKQQSSPEPRMGYYKNRMKAEAMTRGRWVKIALKKILICSFLMVLKYWLILVGKHAFYFNASLYWIRTLPSTWPSLTPYLRLKLTDTQPENHDSSCSVSGRK